MGSLGTPELLLVLVIVLLLFGVGRVSKLGGELGEAVASFRKGVKKAEEEDEKENETTS
jgi:sec-independent protein translocase protein TatA